MLRAVMAGCGAMSQGWLRSIRNDPQLSSSIQIAGLVDLDVKRARVLRDEFDLGDIPCSDNLDFVLESVKPDILFDIVVPSARAGVVQAGLNHGCHVLSEKPLAMSLDEARRLIALAAEKNLTHAVVQNRRFIVGVRRLRAAVEAKVIGDLTAVHCDFFLGPHFGGFREEMDHVLLLDMAIHTFDAARYVIGSAPDSVYCHETNPAGSWYANGAAASAIFAFKDGAIFTYRGSWCAEGANTSWESAWRLVGSRGTILWDGADEFTAAVAGPGTSLLREPISVEIPDVPNPSQTHGHASVIADFIDAISNGRAPETEASDNIKSLAMVLSAIESAQSGQRINVPEK
jgi:predicted dehydrogenase